MEQWIGRGIVLVVLLLLGSAVHWVRGWGAERRRWLMPERAGVRVPLRLRGGGRRYPGYWQVGRLDLATAVWRPRGRWGVPLSLAVAAPHDEPDPAPGRLAGLRTRVPLAAVALVLLGVGWAGYWGMPLQGVRQVDGWVVRNSGPQYLCEVRWADPVRGDGGHGYADCGARDPGEHLPVQVMGWPRSGTVDDPRQTAALLLATTPCFLFIAGMMMASGMWRRRHLRRNIILDDGLGWIG
jgi:hypothetical protein